MLDGAGEVTLRELEYVAAVAAERSFTRAAAGLHMAQPALSQAILRVERRLGVRLFERSSRRVVPTAAGEALAADARELLAGVRRATARARAVGGVAIPLRVHVSDTSLRAPRRLLALWRARLPHLGLHQTTLPHDDVVAGLGDGALAFAVGDRIAGPCLESMLLLREPVGALLAATHPLAGRERLGIADLAEHPLVPVDDALSSWNRYVERLYAAAGCAVHWAPSATFGALAGGDAVADGRAVLLSTASIIEGQPDAVVWRPLEPAQHVGWYLTWHADAARLPAVAAALAVARAFAAEGPTILG